ncbi:Neurotransmitter-gated ion-channel ligand-binding domain [Trinorchestia longiramus]|nr:Neurotransmitter-gated ion-channel ligand-binding domain [Trinorchestia longiramus]
MRHKEVVSDWLVVAVVASCLIRVTPEEGLVGLSFAEDRRMEPREKSIQLSTVISLPDNTSSFSLCCHFKLLFRKEDPAMLLSFDQIGYLTMANNDLYLVEGSSSSYMVSDYKTPVRQWVHVCASFFGGTRVFINGEQKRISNLIDSSDPLVNMKTGRLVVGMLFDFNPVLDMDIGAWITLPVFIPRKISEEEVGKHLKCNPEIEGNLVTDAWQEIVFMPKQKSIIYRNLSLTEATEGSAQGWKPYNSSYNLPAADQLPQPSGHVITVTPCAAPQPELFLLSRKSFSFHSAEKECLKLKGSLPSSDHPSFKQMTDDLLRREDEVSFWINERFENDTCRILIYTGTAFLHMIMACDTEIAQQLVCAIHPNTLFHALGNGMESFSQLYLDKCGVNSCFRTIYRDQIVLSNDGTAYKFISRNQQEVMESSVLTLDVPIGRFEIFNFELEIKVEVVVSVCSEEEFTCSDGSCLPLEQHCDGVGQCANYEDENCLQSVIISENYNPNRAPELLLPVELHVRIGKISDVDISNGHFKVRMELQTVWTDKRLQYLQLREELEKNQLTDDIWYPTYRMAPLVFNDEIDYYNGNRTISTFYASPTTAGSVITLQTRRKRLFDAQVVHREDVSFTFYCDFDLIVYPFGVYPCQYNISFQDKGTNDPFFNLSSTSLELPVQTLSLFVVQFCSLAAGTDNTTTPRNVTVTVLLESRFGGFVLSMFMPCLIITVIGITTLFFEFDNFQDRITVTLSCLIVEAGLYAQVIEVVPISAAPKFIDSLFFYSIIRLFLTCLDHVFTYRFLLRFNNSRAEANEVRSSKALQSVTNNKDMDKCPWHLEVKSNLITPATVRDNPPKATDNVPDAATYLSPKRPKPSFPAWVSCEADEETFKKRYRKFKICYYSSVVFGFTFDLVFLAGSGYLTHHSRASVYNNHPSLKLCS